MGDHRPSATIAIAMKPRPADMPSAKVPTCATTSVPPLNPPNAPPKRGANHRTRPGEIPAAVAAAGFSPTARSARPACVRDSHHASTGAATYTTYVVTGWAKNARPMIGIDDNRGMAVGPAVGIVNA